MGHGILAVERRDAVDLRLRFAGFAETRMLPKRD